MFSPSCGLVFFYYPFLSSRWHHEAKPLGNVTQRTLSLLFPAFSFSFQILVALARRLSPRIFFLRLNDVLYPPFLLEFSPSPGVI